MDGTIDLSMCLELPLIGSKPHFYDADNNIFEQVHGLGPNEEKHDIRIDFDLVNHISNDILYFH